MKICPLTGTTCTIDCAWHGRNGRCSIAEIGDAIMNVGGELRFASDRLNGILCERLSRKHY